MSLHLAFKLGCVTPDGKFVSALEPHVVGVQPPLKSIKLLTYECVSQHVAKITNHLVKSKILKEKSELIPKILKKNY